MGFESVVTFHVDMDLFPNHVLEKVVTHFTQHMPILDIPSPVYMHETGKEGIEYVHLKPFPKKPMKLSNERTVQ